MFDKLSRAELSNLFEMLLSGASKSVRVHGLFSDIDYEMSALVELVNAELAWNAAI